MLTIISMIIGFLGSIVPDGLKLLQDKRDKQHELDMLELQLKSVDAGNAYKMDAIGIQAYSDIVVAGNKAQADMLEKASNWVIDLTASVRPTLTYLFMIMYIGIKIAQFFAAINPSLPWQSTLNYWEAVNAIWSEEDMALWSGVVCFWFGSRELAKRSR